MVARAVDLFRGVRVAAKVLAEVEVDDVAYAAGR